MTGRLDIAILAAACALACSPQPSALEPLTLDADGRYGVAAARAD